MDKYSEIKSLVLKPKNLGVETLEDGTILIGKAPDIAPRAWLNGIFPVLSDEEFRLLSEELSTSIPIEYAEFLKCFSNGLKLFVSVLSLFGLRRSYGRATINAWQPFSVVSINTIERLIDSKDSYFYIGSYFKDGSLLYIDKMDNKVYRCSRDTSKPLNSWDSFYDMLSSEVKRLDALFMKHNLEIVKIDSTPF